MSDKSCQEQNYVLFRFASLGVEKYTLSALWYAVITYVIRSLALYEQILRKHLFSSPYIAKSGRSASADFLPFIIISRFWG